MARDVASARSGPSDIPATLRQRAERVRALARAVAHDAAADTLREYADELEVRAAALDENARLLP